MRGRPTGSGDTSGTGDTIGTGDTREFRGIGYARAIAKSCGASALSTGE